MHIAPDLIAWLPADFLLYGSYGYTGRLVAERARELGLTPLLAGRDAHALAQQAAETGRRSVRSRWTTRRGRSRARRGPW